jgi:hypothetical protein
MKTLKDDLKTGKRYLVRIVGASERPFEILILQISKLAVKFTSEDGSGIAKWIMKEDFFADYELIEELPDVG